MEHWWNDISGGTGMNGKTWDQVQVLEAQCRLECESMASVPRLDWLSASRRAVWPGVELGMSELV